MSNFGICHDLEFPVPLVDSQRLRGLSILEGQRWLGPMGCQTRPLKGLSILGPCQVNAHIEKLPLLLLLQKAQSTQSISGNIQIPCRFEILSPYQKEEKRLLLQGHHQVQSCKP